MVCTSITIGENPVTPDDFLWILYLGAGGLIFGAAYLFYTGYIAKPQYKTQSKKVR